MRKAAQRAEDPERQVGVTQRMEGETPTLVHSQLPNPDTRIDAFRHTEKRWIVSVAMISEGVDIPRLRVLIYLPSALTELAFRQAIGRVADGPEDVLAPVEAQLDWMREANLVQVDCLWKWRGFALLVGESPTDVSRA